MTEKSAAERRAERQEANAKAEAAQYEIDLEALDAAEIAHGDSNVTHVRIPFDPKSPTPVIAIARAPKPLELKRYRDRVKEANPDRIGAAEELAAACRLYPAPELYAQMCAVRPGLHAQLGVTALQLAVGQSAADSKSG